MKKNLVTCSKIVVVFLMALVMVFVCGKEAYADESPRLLSYKDRVKNEVVMAKGYFTKNNKPVGENVMKGNVKFVSELLSDYNGVMKVGKTKLFVYSGVESRIVADGQNTESQFIANTWTDNLTIYGATTSEFNPVTDALYLHISYRMKDGRIRTYDKRILADTDSYVEAQIGSNLKAKKTKGTKFGKTTCITEFNTEDIYKNIDRDNAGTYLSIQMKVVRTTSEFRKLSKSKMVTLGDNMIAGVHNGKNVVTK